MADIHPTILKLYRLDQAAAEAFGAYRAVSERGRELSNERVRLQREVSETESQFQKTPHTLAHIDKLRARIDHLEAASQMSKDRAAELTSRAHDARATADRLREHLTKTLKAGGFMV